MTDQKLPTGTQLDFVGDYPGFWDSGPTQAERIKRKEAGQCQECGTLLPISIWGLGECPSHPAPPIPDHKK